jgi:putative chitinase
MSSTKPPTIPGLTTATQRERAESLLATAYRSGITDPKELANFMGQTQHESQSFSRLEENLNYRGSVLWDTFKGGGKVLPRNGMTEKEAGDLAAIEDPQERRQAIANKIYGGKWGEKFLGNTEADDGYQYRGRGYIQLTGRYNYTEYHRKTGLDLVNQPGLAANPDNAELLAIQYWKDNVQRKTSDRSSVSDAGSIINTGDVGGAVKGLADRQANAAAWETALNQEGYLQGVLERHPAEPPLKLKPTSQLSPESQRLLQGSEQHIRQLAERHHLPWDAGLDNTVAAVASEARQSGLTDITHLKLSQGLIRVAQYDGQTIKEATLDARAAANTDAQQSLNRLAQTGQTPLPTDHDAVALAQPAARASVAPALLP